MDALTTVQDYEIWFGLGCALIIAEILIMGVFNGAMLVAGLSFVLTAFATHKLDLSMGWQFTTLAVFLVVSAIAIKLIGKYLPKKPAAVLNDRESEMIGKVYVLHSAITNGEGDIKVGDALYTVHGEDAEAGTPVRLTAKQGMGFVVEVV